MNRRTLLKALGALLALAPLKALAAMWNKSAFEATQPEQALQGLGAMEIEVSNKITLIAPDFAENGAIVQIEVESYIPNTEARNFARPELPTEN